MRVPRFAAMFMSALAVPLLLVSCSGDPEAAGGDPGAEGEPPDLELGTRVKTWTIETTGFEEKLEVTGLLEPWDEVQVASETGGLVREVLFEKGDRLQAGNVIARIGDDLAQARLAQARADLADAEAQFAKTTRLFQREAVPRQDLDTATARRDRMKAVVREQEILLDRAVLRAPITGFARDRLVEPGEVIAPGAMITTLQRIDRLKVAASVPDTEISWLSVGVSGLVRVDAWPGREFRSRIRFLSPSADESNRSFPIELDLPNDDLALRPGMVVRLELSRRSIADAVAVPLDSLVTRLEGPVAFVVKDCRAVMRPISTSSAEGELVLIDEGLSPGEELVVEGQRDLADGQKVETETCR